MSIGYNFYLITSSPKKTSSVCTYLKTVPVTQLPFHTYDFPVHPSSVVKLRRGHADIVADAYLDSLALAALQHVLRLKT